MKPLFVLLLCAFQAITVYGQPMPYLDKQQHGTRMMVESRFVPI